MSPLPQRKKSPEELARLREDLGIPHLADPQPESPSASEPAPPPAPAEPKPVRSLRKSEQAPVPKPVPPAPGNSSLPSHRHSDRELQEIRRREAIAAMQLSAPDPRKLPARILHIAPGYLMAVVAASCFIWREFPMAATAACALAALAVALSINLLRPVSRHHAAFITMLALLVIVFGALHYFPQLRNAT